MNFVYHPEMFHVLPVISVGDAECGCCGESAGWMLELGWGLWSWFIHFGGSGHA